MVEPPRASPGLFAWGRHRIPSQGLLAVNLGPLSIFVERMEGELRVAEARTQEGDERSSAPAPDAAWTRWASSRLPEEVDILPTFPDRPLVLQPEDPFHLLPDARARIFVRVPLWIQIRAPVGDGVLLLETPTLTLSDTWWGGFAEGELCYWLSIRARRMAPPEIFVQDRVICPLELVNKDREALAVEKLLLRAQHLSIFRGGGSLWSDEIRVRYRGEEVGSDLEMTGRPPQEATGAPRLSGPRVPLAKGFTARTFARLKGIPGLGSTF